MSSSSGSVRPNRDCTSSDYNLHAFNLVTTPKIYFNYQFNAQFHYSITKYMLHYNPRRVSSSTMLIFRRSNCIITASGIVTLCKRLYSTLQSLLSTGILYNRLQRVTIPDAVIIQFDLLKMSMVLLETCRGL